VTECSGEVLNTILNYNRHILAVILHSVTLYYYLSVQRETFFFATWPKCDLVFDVGPVLGVAQKTAKREGASYGLCPQYKVQCMNCVTGFDRTQNIYPS